MHHLARSALRLSAVRSLVATPAAIAPISSSCSKSFVVASSAVAPARNFWHMSKRPEFFSTAITPTSVGSPSAACSCGCGAHHVHTKGQ